MKERKQIKEIKTIEIELEEKLEKELKEEMKKKVKCLKVIKATETIKIINVKVSIKIETETLMFKIYLFQLPEGLVHEEGIELEELKLTKFYSTYYTINNHCFIEFYVKNEIRMEEGDHLCIIIKSLENSEKDSFKNDSFKKDSVEKDSVKKDTIEKNSIEKEEIKKEEIEKEEIEKNIIEIDNIELKVLYNYY